MSVEQNKTLVRRILTDIISKGDFALADELIAPELLTPNLRPGQGPGLEGFKQGLRVIRTAFPDWHSVVEYLVAEGDMVAARWTVHATHQGSFAGIPATGRRISMLEMGFFRISGGKLVEYRTMAEELSMLQQLGVLPSMGLSEPAAP